MKNNKSITNNIVWRLLERFGAQGVTFVVSIVLARLLDPTVYGTVAIVTVITTILQVFVDGGFSIALVQKKDSDNLDFSSVFYFNLVFCSFSYFLLFLAAPIIANIYDVEELTAVIRVLGLTLIISSLKSIQHAYVSKTMQFKKFFFATLGGTITAAIIGIWMAYNGFGVWALVTQYLVNHFIDMVVLWISVRWRPMFAFSFARLKGLFKYGYKIFLSTLIDTIYNDISQLIIGKKYTTADLAYYNKGKSYPQLIMNNVSSSIDSVLFPAMANEQDNKERLKSITMKAIKVGTFVVFPCLFGIAAVAENFVSVVLTDKWLPCVPYIWIFCAMYLFYPLFYPNLNLLKAVGESKKYLIGEILRKAIGITILLITLWIAPIYVALGATVTSFFCFFINVYPTKRIIDFGIKQQVLSVLPNLLVSIAMFVLVFLLGLLPFNKVVVLIMQIVFGIVFYFGIAKLFKLDSYNYARDTFKNILRRKKE